jgi:hypothetical protein
VKSPVSFQKKLRETFQRLSFAFENFQRREGFVGKLPGDPAGFF